MAKQPPRLHLLLVINRLLVKHMSIQTIYPTIKYVKPPRNGPRHSLPKLPFGYIVKLCGITIPPSNVFDTLQGHQLTRADFWTGPDIYGSFAISGYGLQVIPDYPDFGTYVEGDLRGYEASSLGM